jgi:hypothetical protein
MRKAVLAAVASLALGAAAPSGAETPIVVSLPWPPAILPKEPPLAPPSSGLLPISTRFLGRLTNRERVVVGIDTDGEPQSVRVGQRIGIGPLGDYVFTIAAPVRSVLPGPGTRSPPGQRENQIIWEGFSPGNRVLASEAELRSEDSVGALPVRVQVQTTIGGRSLSQGEVRSGPLRVVLTVTNVTAVAASSFTAEPDPADLDLVLARIRAAIKRNVFAEGLNLDLLSPRTRVSTKVAAPLRIEGTLRFAPGTARLAGAPSGVVHFAERLDGLRRGQFRLELRGRAISAGPPKMNLRVRPDAVVDTIRPSQAPRVRLARTIALELAYARKRQYDQFLASPDATGRSATTYIFRTTTASAPIVTSPADSSDDNTLGWIVLGLVLAAGLPAAAVAWAHS